MYEKQKILTPKCLQKQRGVHERKGTHYGVHVFVQESLQLRYENGVSWYVSSGHQRHTETVDKIHVSEVTYACCQTTQPSVSLHSADH